MHQFWITLTQTKAKTQDGNSPKMLCNVNETKPSQAKPNQTKPSQATWLCNFISFISASWGLDNGYGTISKTHDHPDLQSLKDCRFVLWVL
jgi:hypothetical protein